MSTSAPAARSASGTTSRASCARATSARSISRPASDSARRLADRALRHDVGLDAASADRVGGAGPDHRDATARERSRVAPAGEQAVEEQPRAVGRRQHQQVVCGRDPGSRPRAARSRSRARRRLGRRARAGPIASALAWRGRARDDDRQTGQRPVGRASRAHRPAPPPAPTTVTAGAWIAGARRRARRCRRGMPRTTRCDGSVPRSMTAAGSSGERPSAIRRRRSAAARGRPCRRRAFRGTSPAPASRPRTPCRPMTDPAWRGR